MIKRDGVCGIGLDLDGVSAACRCSIDCLEGTVDRAKMVGRYLGNDQWGVVRTDQAVGDPEVMRRGLGHGWGPSS